MYMTRGNAIRHNRQLPTKSIISQYETAILDMWANLAT